VEKAQTSFAIYASLEDDDSCAGTIFFMTISACLIPVLESRVRVHRYEFLT
jgi:hypothetical protein